MSQPPPRLLPLPGTHNVRDLGGYPASEGRSTVWRRFLRADSLHALAPAGRQALLDYGVTTVIDLRHHVEVARSPNPFTEHPGVRYANIPLFEPPATEGNGVPAMPDSLTTLYQRLLDDSQPAFREVFVTIAQAAPGTVLFHCTVGKDRTGLVAALLLALAGVQPAHIIEDYAQTAANITALVAGFRHQMTAAGYTIEDAQFTAMMGSDPATMTATLDHLAARYGGPAAYLRHIGLTDAHRESLADRLLAADLSDSV